MSTAVPSRPVLSIVESRETSLRFHDGGADLASFLGGGVVKLDCTEKKGTAFEMTSEMRRGRQAKEMKLMGLKLSDGSELFLALEPRILDQDGHLSLILGVNSVGLCKIRSLKRLELVDNQFELRGFEPRTQDWVYQSNPNGLKSEVYLWHRIWRSWGFAPSYSKVRTYLCQARNRIIEVDAKIREPVPVVEEYVFHRRTKPWYRAALLPNHIGLKLCYHGNVLSAGATAVPITRPTTDEQWSGWIPGIQCLERISKARWPTLIRALEGQFLGDVSNCITLDVDRIRCRMKQLERS